MQLRGIIKARGHFPSDEAALRLIWLVLRKFVAKWTRSRLNRIERRDAVCAALS
jgi:putative transposase